MYEVIHIYSVGSFLHYREGSALATIIPINATSCFKMFEVCRNLTTLDSSRFNTKNIVDMGCMFLDCENLMSLNVSNFDTSKLLTWVICSMVAAVLQPLTSVISTLLKLLL